MSDITAALSAKITEKATDARAANREAGQAIGALDAERAIQNGLRLRLVKCRTLSAELEDQLQGLMVDAHRELGPAEVPSVRDHHPDAAHYIQGPALGDVGL